MADRAVPVEWLAGEIARAGQRSIYDTIALLVHQGVLLPGTRLPTVRALAASVGVGAHVIADVWTELRENGYIATHGRAGTVVTAPRSSGESPSGPFQGWASVDLVHAHPDPSYLPYLDEALRAAVRLDRHYRQDDRMVPALQSAVAADWPFEAASFTVLPSSHSALRAVLEAHRSPVVAVEEPTLIRVLWALSSLGVRTISVQGDDHGPLPSSVRQAMAGGATTFLYQPQGGVPVGRELSRDRRDELADVLRAGRQVPWIVEEDPIGPLAISDRPVFSLGQVFPERTIRHTQFWRSHGVDLKLSVIGGAAESITRLNDYQIHYGLRTSSLLQEALAWQLGHSGVGRQVVQAARAYARRHAQLSFALAAHDVSDASRSGLFAWIAVKREAEVVRRLAAQGISVVAGRSSFVHESPSGWVRVATTRLPDEPARTEELASAIAAAVWR